MCQLWKISNRMQCVQCVSCFIKKHPPEISLLKKMRFYIDSKTGASIFHSNLDSRALFLSHRGSAIRGFTENQGRKSDVKRADAGKRRERKSFLSASIKFSKARKKLALESRLIPFLYEENKNKQQNNGSID